uniref:peptidylprolyl isomerase n=1 Tax=Arundo donax TaxID=35708 RepID=A0A0A9FL65_ARUDO
MELSSTIGSSLPTPAAMALMSPNPKMTNKKCARGLRPQLQFSNRLSSVACSMMLNKRPSQRTDRNGCSSLQAVSPIQCTENPAQSSVSFKDFCVSVCTEEDGVIMIRVNVAGTLTDSIFDKVFTKNVAAAQPLPGFRQMKGGKTPDVPKEVALHLIGPSKVKKETIKNIITCTVAEYVQKEGLNASKNLKVQQSYEELEAAFEPGKEFCFDAAVHLQSADAARVVPHWRGPLQGDF